MISTVMTLNLIHVLQAVSTRRDLSLDSNKCDWNQTKGINTFILE